MKIIYLIPPSESKTSDGNYRTEHLSFPFEKPLEISRNATEKDLKCSGKRFEEGILLNSNILNSSVLTAIERYSGVMYSAIKYANMSESGKQYFTENFFILSGMYGVLKPSDLIGNYKLPIETKGLVGFWQEITTKTLNDIQADVIIDLLPLSYKKMIDWKKLDSKILRVEFLQEKNGKKSKISHGVKSVKGKWIHSLCETGNINIPNFGEEREKSLEIII